MGFASEPASKKMEGRRVGRKIWTVEIGTDFGPSMKDSASDICPDEASDEQKKVVNGARDVAAACACTQTRALKALKRPWKLRVRV